MNSKQARVIKLVDGQDKGSRSAVSKAEEPFRDHNWFCQLCGRPIQQEEKVNHLRYPKWPAGMYLRVCTNCLREKPRCRICTLPMASNTQDSICTTCKSTLTFCKACGELISGKLDLLDQKLVPVLSGTVQSGGQNVGGVSINGVGIFCERCYKNRPPCDICGAPLTDQSWQLSDGRISCAYCHATAINDPTQAEALYKEMQAIADERLGMRLNVPTGLALVDRAQLAEIIRKQTNKLNSDTQNPSLDPQRTLGIYARRGIRRGLYVQTGLPRILMLQVAAHEFAHAWQGENCPVLREPLVHEGFAEWVAYKILGFYGYTHQQTLMQSRDDLYGQGLKWAKTVETQAGAHGVIQACLDSY